MDSSRRARVSIPVHPKPADRDAAGAEPAAAATGRIAQIIRGRQCGFIRTSGGQNVFFHKTDLLNSDFDRIEDNLDVRFTLVPDSVSGPRATAVRVLRREQKMRSAGVDAGRQPVD